jgi:hypothetical protein
LALIRIPKGAVEPLFDSLRFGRYRAVLYSITAPLAQLAEQMTLNH